jgi:tetratricopeptide (TPR) repeat protein
MMSRTAGNATQNRRIDSWKEIAAFFGRDERTVKRWEKERGLPVHRLPGERGGVFAWSQELTDWLNSAAEGNGHAQDAALPAPPVPPPLEPHAPGQPPLPSAPVAPPSHTLLWIAAVVVAILAAIAGSFLFLRRPFSEIGLIRDLRPAAPHRTPDPVAEEYYLQGRYYWSRRTEGSLRQAIDAFTQAVVHDPSYPQAYAGLAECYDIMPEFSSMPRSEAFPRAIAAARKAVELDGSLAEAHRALGFALFYWEWKIPAALGEYQRAIQLDPRDEEAHHWYATSLLTLGRYQEARIEIDKAQQLAPASRSILSDQALIRFWSGDREAAIKKLKEIEREEPEFISAPRYLAGIAFAQKDYRAFIDQSKRLAAISSDAQLAAIAQAAQRGLSKGGPRGMLEAMRVVQQHFFDSGQSSGLDLARTCALLGRNQDAVTYLKAAIAAHDYMVIELSSDQAFAPLNNDPAFEQLLREITARMYRA